MQPERADMSEELAVVAKRVPSGCEWSTGTGTKQSHAQILAPHIRRHSFYAVADTEAEALSMAVNELEDFVGASRLISRGTEAAFTVGEAPFATRGDCAPGLRQVVAAHRANRKGPSQ